MRILAAGLFLALLFTSAALAQPGRGENPGFAPTLYVDSDPVNRDKYLRVEEQRFSPFANGSADHAVRDRSFDGYDGAAVRITDTPGASVEIENVVCRRVQFCVFLARTGTARIYNMTMLDEWSSNSIYGQAIFVGNEGPNTQSPSTGVTYVQRVYADGRDEPDFTYDARNTDFLSSEWNNEPIYLRDVTIKNWGDAGIDTKSPVYIMNATIDTGFNAIKVWPRRWREEDGEPNRVVIVNSIVNGSNWMQLPSSIIEYYNVLWNGKREPSLRDVYSDDSGGHGEKTARDAIRWVHRLRENPLPALSPFFATRIDRIRAEYSADGGRSWRPLDLPNTGENGIGPIGDTRYRIPLDLGRGDYLFRARYERDGRPVGGYSDAVDENGDPVRDGSR